MAAWYRRWRLIVMGDGGLMPSWPHTQRNPWRGMETAAGGGGVLTKDYPFHHIHYSNRLGKGPFTLDATPEKGVTHLRMTAE